MSFQPVACRKSPRSRMTARLVTVLFGAETGWPSADHLEIGSVSTNADDPFGPEISVIPEQRAVGGEQSRQRDRRDLIAKSKKIIRHWTQDTAGINVNIDFGWRVLSR